MRPLPEYHCAKLAYKKFDEMRNAALRIEFYQHAPVQIRQYKSNQNESENALAELTDASDWAVALTAPRFDRDVRGKLFQFTELRQQIRDYYHNIERYPYRFNKMTLEW